jgi:hypothetical protein
MLKVFFFVAVCAEERIGPQVKGSIREWATLHYEELCNAYSLQNLIRAIKLRRIVWTVHTARIGEMRDSKFYLGNLKRRDHFGKPRYRWKDNF